MILPGGDGKPEATSTASPADAVSNRDPTHRTIFWKVCQTLSQMVAKQMFDFHKFGTRNIPSRGGVLVLSNHQSNLDPPMIGISMRRPMAFLAKSELFENPALSWLIRNLNAFPIRQGAGDIGAMRESIRLLQAGWLLNVFPEGSRTPDGELKPAQKGSPLLVRRAGVPVVPAVIDGTYDSWPRGQKWPTPRPVSVLFGKPVELADRKPADILKFVDDTFAVMLDDLRAGRVGKYV